ncbi:EamA family transporter RarD [Natronosporangium hydrolyticum]|uniref:EamA family transporter RarD n=1 Tax=Natronosporangium hydrolyticum TaxID=2811111 RepID=A0A895YIC4_9ACTN|nr:EamA family transporter RarD [Natronosporangium hydrolyticum]QSB14326.1 EamA family transporter RarD [Natronosporangium hydrolyticum]
MSALQRGYLFGLAAYGLWGFVPLYFKLLEPSSPLEILAHRVVWSVLFLALVLLVIRGWSTLRGFAGQPLAVAGLTLAAILIGLNWGTFIYGVATDRVVEASLGYFINPLVTMLLGVLVLRERLTPAQWTALGVGAAAVTVLTIDHGRLPYIALILAGSFGCYGLLKKQLGLPAVSGLLVESSILALPALGFLWWLSAQGEATAGTAGVGHLILLLLAGAITAVPLLFFAGAANRIPLTALGILQYLAPTLQFLLGVLLFAEPMPPTRLAGFALVWLALAIFTADGLRRARQRAAATAAQAKADAETVCTPEAPSADVQR